MDDVLGPLDRLSISTTSPDGGIMAVQSGRNTVKLRFQPRAYERYGAEQLGSQLAQLATRAWVNYRRAYFQAFSEARGETITGAEPPRSDRERQFKQAQAALEVDGESPKGWVSIRSVGLMRWRVEVRSGFNRSLTEQQFLAEVGAALGQLLRDYFDKVLQLQVKHFGLQLPERQPQQGQVRPRNTRR